MSTTDHIRTLDSAIRLLHATDVAGTRSAHATSGGVALSLSATPDAPALARRAARTAFAHWDQDRRDAALLVISELVTNAVRHGSDGPDDLVGLRVQRRGRATRIEVSDTTGGVGDEPVADHTSPRPIDARSGWGLPIVEELTDRWGVEHRGSCTCVWCELDTA